jgi:hypothetical protein
MVVRDLGEHGTVEFVDGPRRAYHLVTADGKRKRLASVTTVLGCLEKRALYNWHEAQGAEGVIRAIRSKDLDPHDCVPQEAIEVVRALGLGAAAAKQKAADRGLDVHGALEAYCETGELPNIADMAPDARPYLSGLAKWLLKYDPTPIHTERIVCHPELAYAGRFDLLAEIGGLTMLCDLKTSRTGQPWPEAHLQLRGYADAEVAVGEDEPGQLIAVGVSPDGLFCHEPCVAAADSFAKVLAVYRLRSQLDRDVRAARKAA